MSLSIDRIRKNFGDFRAVDDISFEVQPGRMFGFLGTNGAGKTTTMRMVLDIIRPDSGQITLDGRSNQEIPRNQFGYLPEERGLYPKMKVEEQLLFLAQLYGAEKATAKRSLDGWLKRLEIEENRDKLVDQLSKGNQQKIQFLAAVLHDPQVLVLDEPFSGLDPVNAAQMKSAFQDMRDQGKIVIFSTHQLDQAQEMCEDVAIIHRGKMEITGDVQSVRGSSGQKILRLGVAGDSELDWLSSHPDAQIRHRRREYVEMQISDESVAERILQDALQRRAQVTLYEVTVPSLNDIFLSEVQGVGDSMSDIEQNQTTAREEVLA